MFVGHMSTLKIIDKHEVLLTCHLKVKKKKKQMGELVYGGEKN